MFSKKTELLFILLLYFTLFILLFYFTLRLGCMLGLHKINFLFVFFRRKFYNMVIASFKLDKLFLKQFKTSLS